MNDPNLIEATELEIWQVIEKAHKKGVNYIRLLWLLHEIDKGMMVKIETDSIVKGGVAGTHQK